MIRCKRFPYLERAGEIPPTGAPVLQPVPTKGQAEVWPSARWLECPRPLRVALRCGPHISLMREYEKFCEVGVLTFA